MAKLVLNDIAGLTADVALNSNFTAIEAAIENTLSRDGTSPNPMGADLDMNSYDLNNVSVLRTTQFFLNGTEVTLDDIGGGGGGGSGDITKVGTPVDNQIGVWTGDGTLEGDAGLLWDGNSMFFSSDLSADGFPTGRMIYDSSNADHDWYISRNIEFNGVDWLLGRAGHSPAGIFFNGEGTTIGKIVIATKSHGGSPVGTDMDRPDSWDAGIECTASSNRVRITTGGSIRLSVGDTETVIDDLRIGNGGKCVLAASTSATPSMNIPHGDAPSAPADGDMWTTTAGLYVRINGVTVGPLS